MTDKHELKLIEALKKVDVYGDVAPPHVHDPIAICQIAIAGNLMGWDTVRDRFVLTGTGRSRISPRRTSGTVVHFRSPTEKVGALATVAQSRR